MSEAEELHLAIINLPTEDGEVEIEIEMDDENYGSINEATISPTGPGAPTPPPRAIPDKSSNYTSGVQYETSSPAVKFTVGLIAFALLHGIFVLLIGEQNSHHQHMTEYYVLQGLFLIGFISCGALFGYNYIYEGINQTAFEKLYTYGIATSGTVLEINRTLKTVRCSVNGTIHNFPLGYFGFQGIVPGELWVLVDPQDNNFALPWRAFFRNDQLTFPVESAELHDS